MLRLISLLCLVLFACQSPSVNESTTSNCAEYLDNKNNADRFEGGIKMIPIKTPKGNFKVWTKRTGNNPKIKVLLLHGGPGMTHEIYECFDGYFPTENIEYYYYDQLGSYYSDQPEDLSLWDLPRFVEEVEQVRQALNLDASNFFLFGQSWGGILAMEYALKYQQHLKGLIISNMVASIPDYQMYSDSVLAPQLPPEVLSEILSYENKEDYGNPRYLELIVKHYYSKHVIRIPEENWPEPIQRGFKHLNPDVYVTMQGPSEFGIKGDATLKNWDIKDLLPKISVPTLTIGAQYDTMDPEHMKWIASTVKNGRYHHCPNGSHLCQFDDQEIFFEGLIQFLNDVNNETF